MHRTYHCCRNNRSVGCKLACRCHISQSITCEWSEYQPDSDRRQLCGAARSTRACLLRGRGWVIPNSVRCNTHWSSVSCNITCIGSRLDGRHWSLASRSAIPSCCRRNATFKQLAKSTRSADGSDQYLCGAWTRGTSSRSDGRLARGVIDVCLGSLKSFKVRWIPSILIGILIAAAVRFLFSLPIEMVKVDTASSQMLTSQIVPMNLSFGLRLSCPRRLPSRLLPAPNPY